MGVWIPITWLLTGVLLTAPAWAAAGPGALVLGLLGPLGVLLFKPGENLASKIIVVLLIASPSIIGLTVLILKWSGLGVKGRVLSVVGLSVLWHGIGAGLWLFILSGFN